MRSNVKLTSIVLAAALSLPAGAALAQEANVADMMAGLSMLEANTQMALNKYGIEANVMDLSLGQLALIGRVLTDPDADTDGNSRKATIAFIVGRM
jgi:hypothetical protein